MIRIFYDDVFVYKYGNIINWYIDKLASNDIFLRVSKTVGRINIAPF